MLLKEWQLVKSYFFIHHTHRALMRVANLSNGVPVPILHRLFLSGMLLFGKSFFFLILINLIYNVKIRHFVMDFPRVSILGKLYCPKVSILGK